MKTFYAAEVLGEGKSGQPKYVGPGGRLVSTPHFFASHKTLRYYLSLSQSYRLDRYNAQKMAARTRLLTLKKQDTLQTAKIEVITASDFEALMWLSVRKAASYSAYATFRLRKIDGKWVSTTTSGGKFGKTWTTAGALRRHIGDRIRWLNSAYQGATVHVTIYDNEGIRVVETRAIPVLEFFLQSPIYAKRWEEINTPTTISAGHLTGRLARSELV